MLNLSAPARDALFVFTNKRRNRIKLAPEALHLLWRGCFAACVQRSRTETYRWLFPNRLFLH